MIGIELANLPPLYLRALAYAAGYSKSGQPSPLEAQAIISIARYRSRLDDDTTDDEAAIRIMQFLPADLWPQRGNETAVDLES